MQHQNNNNLKQQKTMTDKEKRRIAWEELKKADKYNKYNEKNYSDFVSAVKNERISLRRLELQRENIFVDAKQLLGGTVADAIQILSKLPKDGTFQTINTWDGFELRVVTYSNETDEEYSERLFESFDNYMSQKNYLKERQKKLEEIKSLEEKLQLLKTSL